MNTVDLGETFNHARLVVSEQNCSLRIGGGYAADWAFHSAALRTTSGTIHPRFGSSICSAMSEGPEHDRYWGSAGLVQALGGRSFHDREEVIALRNAITAIEWPDDELKVFATLRGPFFALGDEALLAFRQYVDGNGS